MSNSNNEFPPFLPSITRDELWQMQSSTSIDLPRDNKQSIHLVLHFDINETILLGDEAGGDTREDCLSKMLAKSAFVQMPIVKNGQHDGVGDEKSTAIVSSENTSQLVPTHWWNGEHLNSPSTSTSMPPLYTKWEWPTGCCPYYRTSYKQRSKTFVEHHGKAYKPFLELLEKRLAQQHLQETHPVLPHVLPAFFETLQELSHRPDSQFTIVLRTMGSDLHDIAQALSLCATGKHPNYANFQNDKLKLTPQQLYQGKWTSESPHVYQLWQDDCLIASGDSEVVRLIQSHTVCGIQDDYAFWKSHDYVPWAGKPVWIPLDRCVQHVLLDDNIHNLQQDGIASVRRQVADGSWETLSSDEILKQHGKHLIRTPTIEPILNPRWFLEQIDAAMERVRQDRAAAV